jgi:hypothetical protein
LRGVPPIDVGFGSTEHTTLEIAKFLEEKICIGRTCIQAINILVQDSKGGKFIDGGGLITPPSYKLLRHWKTG